MPPTRAAARKTACGRAAAIHCSTCSDERKSHCSRGATRISHSSSSSRRTSAEPTRPPCPATQMCLPRNAYEIFSFIFEPSSVDQCAVGFDHLGDQRRETDLVAPAELPACLLGIAEQQVDFGRPVIDGVDRDEGRAGSRAIPLLVEAAALPDDRPVDAAEGKLDEFPDRVGLAGGENVV